jgi:hypothetical protein
MGMQFKESGSAAVDPLTFHRPVLRNGSLAVAQPSALQFWRGASGRHYVHTVFDLISCPRLPACSYVLAYRDASGRRRALRIGTVSAEAWSLNLAEIRHRASQLGANEVHAHLIAADTEGRARTAQDLQASQFAELSAEPTERPARLC